MIQRQQTLWLLLAGAASFFSFQYPFYVGTKLENNTHPLVELDAASNFFLLVLTGLSILIALIAIFLFKDRKTQLKVTIAGVILSFVLLLLYFMQIKNFDPGGRFALTSVLVIAIPLGYVMAARGIWKDEKLVKSLDKLR
ncbi:MAG: DUF4293 domain-containing protein [Chitinophagaceae bacterium]